MAASSLEDPRWPPRTDCLFYLKINLSLSPLLFGDRPPLFRRAGWCWCDRQEDHCRHIRRVGSSRRRRFLWQRLLEGRSLCCLRRSLGGQVSGQSQTVQESPGSGECPGSPGHAGGLCRLKRRHALIKPPPSSRLCVLQVSYAIGVAHPLSISLFTYGSSEKTETELLHIVNKNFDLRPGVIVR